jgi:flagellar M-ring protein FliF
VAGTCLADLPPLTGEIDDGSGGFPEMAVVADFGFGDDGDSPADPGPDADPVERLRALIEARQEETVEILRGWMEDEREEA